MRLKPRRPVMPLQGWLEGGGHFPWALPRAIMGSPFRAWRWGRPWRRCGIGIFACIKPPDRSREAASWDGTSHCVARPARWRTATRGGWRHEAVNVAQACLLRYRGKRTRQGVTTHHNDPARARANGLATYQPGAAAAATGTHPFTRAVSLPHLTELAVSCKPYPINGSHTVKCDAFRAMRA